MSKQKQPARIVHEEGLSLGQLAEAWDKSPSLLRTWMASGWLVADGPNGALTFSPSAQAAFLNAHPGLV